MEDAVPSFKSSAGKILKRISRQSAVSSQQSAVSSQQSET
jgi:hypothetical protein